MFVFATHRSRITNHYDSWLAGRTAMLAELTLRSWQQRPRLVGLTLDADRVLVGIELIAEMTRDLDDRTE